VDSLTQIILGAAVGEAVLGKKVGNKALLWGGIAGTLPDLDVLFATGGPIQEIVKMRNWGCPLSITSIINYFHIKKDMRNSISMSSKAA